MLPLGEDYSVFLLLQKKVCDAQASTYQQPRRTSISGLPISVRMLLREVFCFGEEQQMPTRRKHILISSGWYKHVDTMYSSLYFNISQTNKTS